MTKKELIKEVASHTGLSTNDAALAVNQTLESITSTMASGQQVVLRGFGNFKVVNRKSHKGRNLLTGDMVTIPAKNVVKFIPSKNLNEKVI